VNHKERYCIVSGLPFVIFYSNSITYVQCGSHILLYNKNMNIYLYKGWWFIVQSAEITVTKFLSCNHTYRKHVMWCDAPEPNGEKN